jgi:predicted NBD/HSP70 family sugar kinase
LRSLDAATRADLADRLGTRKDALDRVLDDLINCGLVSEGRTAGRGAATVLRLESAGRCIASVHVRPARTFVTLTDLSGRKLSTVESFPTLHESSDFVLRLTDAVRRLVAAQAEIDRCQAVDVVFSGAVEHGGRVVLHAPLLGWGEATLRARLTAALGLPCDMQDAAVDGMLSLWIEPKPGAAHGPARDAGNLGVVSVSDDVGVGIVIYGDVPGHSLESARPMRWQQISNAATIERYLGRSREGQDPQGRLDIEELIGKARAGDVRALSALFATAHALGACLASLVRRFSLARIYLDGEIASAWDVIERAVRGGLASSTGSEAAAVEIVALSPHRRRLRGAALVGSILPPRRVA